MVPVVGLEPTRHRWQRILSPPRLPFQHTGTAINSILHLLPDCKWEFRVISRDMPRRACARSAQISPNWGA